jgi:tetratricopeptide (TPR) repeat protein
MDQSIECYNQGLTIAREIEVRRHESVWLGHLGQAYCAERQFELAIEYFERSLVIADDVGYISGRSMFLIGLSKGLLTIGNISKAREHCVEALKLEIQHTSYQAALVLGIVLLHQRDGTVENAFIDAIARCRRLLSQTPNLYEPQYALATAVIGRAVCKPHWQDEVRRSELLLPALSEYQRALEICAAPGVVQDVIRDVELIQAAGIEGLEPVFSLLQEYAGPHFDLGFVEERPDDQK